MARCTGAGCNDDDSIFLDDPAREATATARTVDADHGRIETRAATVSTAIARVPFRNLFKVSGAAPDAGKLGDAAKGSAATNPPAIAAEDDKTFTIDQTFTKSLTVCYLAQRFTLKNVGAGAGGSIRDAQLIEEYWHPNTEK